MNISVVIPTFNGKNDLKKCLNSVFKQTYAKRQYEIIIIDDGSTDGTNRIINKMKYRKNIRYFRQKNQGPAAARNSGIKRARGTIVAFIDDDCSADKYWLESISDSHNRAPENIAAIGGSTLVRYTGKNIIAKLDQEIINYHVHEFQKGREVLFLPTANLSLRKNVCKKIGYFDEDFRGASGEDSEFCWRATKNGYRLIYEPKMKVEHFQRNNLISFLSQNFSYGKTMGLIRKKHFEPFHIKSDFLSVLAKSFNEIFLFPFKMTKIFSNLDEKIIAWFLTLLRQIVFFMGLISAKMECSKNK